MRKLILIAILALLMTTAVAENAVPSPDSGLMRATPALGCWTAQDLANDHSAELSDGVPLYAPAHPQPLNACMATHEDCEVGIDLDGMYKVRDTGLVDAITGSMTEWMEAIEAASGLAIRFVDDPDDADVLVCARQAYRYYGDYSGDGRACSAYSCTVTLEAVQLTHPENRFSFSATNRPGETITTLGGSKFWMYPPELAGSEDLPRLVEAVLGWYGFGAQNGMSGEGVRSAQQSLIDRGFLDGSADGSFGPRTEAAVKALQAAYGLEETGVIDRGTLVALYYNADALGAAE